MIDNLYKHNARSYWDVYNALIGAYPKKPTWIFKEMAGLFDFQSELMNRIATDILYPQTRESAYAFASRCDYEPVEADGATDTITFTLVGNMVKTLSSGYRVAGISTATGEMLIYELTEDASSGGTDTITASVKQKKTITDHTVGNVINSDDFYDYPIDGYTKIIKSSISLTIDSNTWTRVDNFDNSEATDRHFMLLYQSSGKSRVLFGNGITGAKPTVGSMIYATFEVTNGLDGQMDAGLITINSDGDGDISSLTNAGTSGGNDAESVASILRNSRGNVRLRDVVWSKEDLETAARTSSSSVIKALGVPGTGAATIQIVPSNGGNPSVDLKNTVDTYVTSKTLFGVMPITVINPNYAINNCTANITVRTGFVDATVKNLTEFALVMARTAIDNQLIEYYDDHGIDETRINIINSVWAWAFTEDENEALAYIINKWKVLLGDREYREWGQDLEVGNLWVMGDSLYDYGVDTFALTSPTTNVVVATDEICDDGTTTVTVI